MSNKIYNYPFYSHKLVISGYPEINRFVSKNFKKCKLKLQQNIKLYALNLAIWGKVAVSRDKNWYSHNEVPDWHGYSKAKKAQDLLIEKGFATIEEGGYKSEGFTKGISSILSPTPAFKKLFSGFKITDLKVDTKGLFDLIIKETVNKKITHAEFYRYNDLTEEQDKKISEYGDSRLGFLMSSVHTLNKDYFKKMKLGFSKLVNQKMVSNVYLTSIITNRGGGRLHQQGGLSFQNIKKENRKFLTINGKPTVEVDISASHLSLLYGKKREVNPYSDDSYMLVVKRLIGRKNKDVREAVKKCILISLNASKLQSCSGAFRTEHPELAKTLKDLNITPKMVIAKFGEVHPAIKEYLNTGVSMDCMLAEAQILVATLLRMRYEKILGLPLHDSIITTKEHEERVKYILGEEFFEFNLGYGTSIETK